MKNKKADYQINFFRVGSSIKVRKFIFSLAGGLILLTALSCQKPADSLFPAGAMKTKVLLKIQPQGITPLINTVILTVPEGEWQPVYYPRKARVSKLVVGDSMLVGLGDLLMITGDGPGPDSLERTRSLHMEEKDKFIRAEEMYAKKLIGWQRFEEIRERYTISEDAYNRLKKSIDQKSLKSPLSGIIRHCLVSEGEEIQEGQEILTIQRLDTIQVEILFQDDRINLVKKGQAVSLASFFSNASINGQIIETKKSGKQEGSIYQLTIRLDQNGRKY